jgi:hypothetical protein
MLRFFTVQIVVTGRSDKSRLRTGKRGPETFLPITQTDDGIAHCPFLNGFSRYFNGLNGLKKGVRIFRIIHKAGDLQPPEMLTYLFPSTPSGA